MKPYAFLLGLSLLAPTLHADDILKEGPRLFSDEALERACEVMPVWDTRNAIDIRKMGAVGLKHTYDKTKATVVQQASVALVNSVMMKKHEITAKDQLDWIAIQAALVKAGKSKNVTVIIPAGTYYLSRELWIPSFTRVIWQDGAKVVMVGKSIAGTVISNVNPYNRAAYHHYDDLVCRIELVNPRVDAGGAFGIKGENGVSFANGAKNIIISGGEITNARWGTMADSKAGHNMQGGRGIQLEQGVANISVRGTVVKNSSIGFSSSAGLSSRVAKKFNPWRSGLPGEIQSLDKAYNITFYNLTVQNPTKGAGAIKIGAILNAYGKNVKIYDLNASGVFATLFNFSGDMLNLKGRAYLVENMEVRRAKLSGKTDTLQRYDSGLTRGSTLVGAIDISKLVYNKKNLASLLGPEVVKFSKDLKSKIVMQYFTGTKKPYEGRTASIRGLEANFNKFF